MTCNTAETGGHTPLCCRHSKDFMWVQLDQGMTAQPAGGTGDCQNYITISVIEEKDWAYNAMNIDSLLVKKAETAGNSCYVLAN